MRAAARELVTALVERGLHVACAESLTGGQLTAALVDVPGASATVRGGIVAYDTAIKRSVVGVDADLLTRVGAVHPEVARQLATRVRHVLAVDGVDAEIGIATTGVAGPDGQDGQPVGRVFIGVAVGDDVTAIGLDLDGDRATIRAGAVDAALDAALAAIVRLDPSTPAADSDSHTASVVGSRSDDRSLTRSSQMADDVTVVRTFDAPQNLVYSMFTTPEHFATWFGTDQVEVPLDTLAMDVREGGEWSAVMHLPDGSLKHWAGAFRRLVPFDLVEFTLTDEPGTTEPTPVTAELRADGSGTELTLTQATPGWPAEAQEGLRQGYGAFLDTMAAILAREQG